MFGVIVFFVLLVTVINYMWNRRDLYRLSWQIPGPVAYPLIGNAHLLIGANHEGLLKGVRNSFKKYESFHRYWIGPKLYILISSPEHIQSTLYSMECLNRDDVYDFVNLLGEGGGLLNLKDQKWKEHRKFLSPCFNSKILQSYMPIFNKEAQILVKKLSNKVSEESFNFYDSMDACTLDMICQTTLGTEMHIQEGQNVEYLSACNKLFQLITIRIFRPWFHSDLVFKMSKLNKKMKALRKITSAFVDKVLHSKMVSMKQPAESSAKFVGENNDEFISYKKPQILIDQLLDMYNIGQLSALSEIKAHAATNIATGFETSALISSYAVLMLAIHPEIQEKVYKEIQNIYGDDEIEIQVQYHHFNQLEYLDRVLKETLRLFPVVPYFARKVSKAFYLDNYKIPADVRILISMIQVHHDPHLWGPNARVFDPDNFLPEKICQRHPFSYIPFGGGIRNCIGMKYAMFSMKTILIHLLLSYKFKTNLKMENLRTRVDVTLKLINKHMVSIEKR